jgi:hypothetical protein
VSEHDDPQPRPEYVRPAQPIPVEVRHDDGCWYPGTVRGFRGRRMSVRYTTAPGSTYDRAVDAELVRLPA